MRRAQRGDQEAFAVLVHRHVDALYRYALRLTQLSSSAEDLVQDTWLAAWANAGRYKPRKTKVTTWLHTILQNKFIDTQRKKETQNVQQDKLDMAQESNSAALDAPYLNDAHLMTINQLLNKLPVNQRSAIVLSHLQGFSNREVANIMGISVRALESLLVRARTALKQQYDETPSIQTANGCNHT